MSNIKATRSRFRMYRNYIKELSKYDRDLKYNTAFEINEWARSYMEDEEIGYATWIDITCEDNLAGFLIISHWGGDCHPDCDHYISQAYVLPQYRHRGLMSTAVTSYVNDHPGTYGLDVLEKNMQADKFWKELLSRLEIEMITLSPARSKEIESKYKVYGFKKWR